MFYFPQKFAEIYRVRISKPFSFAVRNEISPFLSNKGGGGGGFKGISWTTRERGTKHDDKTCTLNTRLSSFHGSLSKKSRSKKTIVTAKRARLFDINNITN